MTEETDSTGAAPGSSAGDAAPTQAIPRIPKPASKKSSKKASAKDTLMKRVGAQNGGTQNGAVQPGADQTDKGRPRPGSPPPPPETSAAAEESQAFVADKKRTVDANGGPTGRPLTSKDYARTTKQSPASTSIIPAIREKLTGQPKGDKAPSATMSPSAGGSGRQASLRLTHVEPWSVTRLAFAISVAMMIVSVVAVAIFWIVLNVAGVWDQINESLTSVLSDETSSFSVTDYFGFFRLVGLTLVLSAVNVVLTTALATIAAHLYNVAAQLMGGVEVTFAEDK